MLFRVVSTQRDPDKGKECGLEKSGILIGLKCKVALLAVAQRIEHLPANESPGSKGSVVHFPVRAQIWAMGQVPNRGRLRGNYTLMFHSFLPPFPFL